MACLIRLGPMYISQCFSGTCVARVIFYLTATDILNRESVRIGTLLTYIIAGLLYLKI